jgi:hypothetical protein
MGRVEAVTPQSLPGLERLVVGLASSAAALFEGLARLVSVNPCNDPTFGKFRNVLQKWFSA